MEFEQQKPITDEYRTNWERIYLQNHGTFSTPEAAHSMYCQVASMLHGEFYKSGCPILSEGPQKDDI